MKKLFFVFLFLAVAVVSKAQDVPADYPADLPKPMSAKFISSSTDLGATTYNFESELSPLTIFESFKSEMEKNKFVMNTQGSLVMNEAGGMVNWSKDEKTVLVVLSAKADKSTSIVIIYK